MSPRQAILLGENMEAYGCEDFYICERGTSFGYDNLVVDFRTIHKLKSAGFKVCFDSTHSTQEGGESTTGGNWFYAQPLAQSAKIWGVQKHSLLRCIQIPLGHSQTDIPRYP